MGEGNHRPRDSRQFIVRLAAGVVLGGGLVPREAALLAIPRGARRALRAELRTPFACTPSCQLRSIASGNAFCDCFADPGHAAALQ